MIVCPDPENCQPYGEHYAHHQSGRGTSPVHPMQPLVMERGVVRFQANAIVCYLFDTGALDLNALAVLPFSNEDRMQIAQLLGYSVSGFGDLSYADPDVVAAAGAAAEQMTAPASTPSA